MQWIVTARCGSTGGADRGTHSTRLTACCVTHCPRPSLCGSGGGRFKVQSELQPPQSARNLQIAST
eukprot:scaffold829_cov174-Ochromonas_danica.AAC.9